MKCTLWTHYKNYFENKLSMFKRDFTGENLFYYTSFILVCFLCAKWLFSSGVSLFQFFIAHIPFIVAEYMYFFHKIENLHKRIKYILSLSLIILSSFFYALSNKILNLYIQGDPSNIIFTRVLVVAFLILFSLILLISFLVLLYSIFVLFFVSTKHDEFNSFLKKLINYNFVRNFLRLSFSLLSLQVLTSANYFLKQGDQIIVSSLFYVDGYTFGCGQKEENSVFIRSGNRYYTKIHKNGEDYNISLMYCEKGTLSDIKKDNK